MEVEKVLRISLILSIAMLCAFFLGPNIYAEDYKDASPELRKTIKDFEGQGILKEFIDKYGSSYFRPSSTVTRKDLLMALHEYDRLSKTLFEYQKALSKKISKLKALLNEMRRREMLTHQRNSTNNFEIDKITAEVLKAIPRLMDTMPVPKQVEEDLFIIKNKLSLLEKPYKTINERMITNILRKSPKVRKIIKKEVRLTLAKEKSTKYHSNSLRQLKNDSRRVTEGSKTLTKISIGLSLIAILFMAR